jgi:hypothetical protein
MGILIVSFKTQILHMESEALVTRAVVVILAPVVVVAWTIAVAMVAAQVIVMVKVEKHQEN